MERYLIEIRDLNDLSKYITLLESFKLQGEIHIEQETLRADDILLMCEKCILKKVWLKVTKGEKSDKNSIFEYLKKNNLLVSREGESFMEYVIGTKRIYLRADASDGHRILVDRLWPRGISKEKAQVEYWYKEIAPSSALRNQFHDGKTTYEQFKQLYVDELERNPEASLFVEGCRKWLETDCVTFLFGKKDEEQNNAVALRDWVTGKLKHNCF